MILQIIPAPDVLPAHWMWSQVLLLVTFLLHLVLMNFIVGGSIFTLWDSFKGKTVKNDAFSIPTLIALTINFGVPPLLFVQVIYGQFFYSSSILMAVPWLLVIPFLILGYYGAYIFVYKTGKNKALARGSLVLSTLILLYIGFMLVNNSTLMLRPERWSMYFENPGGTNLNWGEPTLFPRYLHFMTGAIAIAGLGKALWYYFRKKTEPQERDSEMKRGIKIFAYATVVQIALGIIFLFTLPSEIYSLFLGGNMIYTILISIGFILALAAVIQGLKQQLRSLLIIAPIILAIMVVMRELVRHAYFGDIYTPGDMVLQPEYGSLTMFLVVFLAGLYLIYYMLKLMLKPKTDIER
ncbi:MAG: hypothetical protein K9I94_08330 [Bacteroidales bacterium]|nr:hypothetical protein [Bacteroidales bacterium]